MDDVSPTPGAEGAAPPPPASPPGAAGDAPRRPRNAEKRERDAAAAKLRRRMAAAKSAAELEAMVSKLDGPQVDAGVAAAAAAPAEEKKAPAAPPSPELVAQFAPLAKTAWETSARILGQAGPRWRLREEEIKALADATAPVLAKYVPQLLASPEFMLGLVMAGVFTPRIVDEVKERRAAKRAKAVQGPPPDVSPAPAPREEAPPAEQPATAAT